MNMYTHVSAAVLHVAALEAAEAAADFEGMLDGVDAIKAAFGSDAGAVITTFGGRAR